MDTRKSPKEIAEAMCSRSVCMVQVGSCIADAYGVFSWGHNHSGPTGMGLHAEVHSIFRSNRKRLRGATIYVAARWRDSGRVCTSKPCVKCQQLIDRFGLNVRYRDSGGVWR